MRSNQKRGAAGAVPQNQVAGGATSAAARGAMPGAAARANAAASAHPATGELPVIEVRDLQFSYGDNQVLRGINLGIQRGKVTTIMGGNGCGKSTLFNLMTKNLQPDSGKIFLRGRNIQDIGLKDFAREISIVHQYNTAASDITVEQLVNLGRTPYLKPMSVPTEEDERIVHQAMNFTNTAQYRLRPVSALSGGQRQRVWIAMALAQHTKILFLDEPTTYLDIRYQIEILELVRRLNRQFGTTIVMVLHDINQAIHYSDAIIGLHDGKVAVSGDPEQVITPATIKQLFGIDLIVAQVKGHKYVLLKDD